MPHIHGVAWICKDYLKSIGITGNLCDFPEKTAVLADKLVSCSLNSGDQRLDNIVKEVQRHSHSKSCRKYGTSCRYGFPRLPSRRTLLAKPLPDTMCEDEKIFRKEKAKKILSVAKELLESPDIDENMTFDKYLETIGAHDDEYHEAISIMEKGHQMVLKRSVNERFINNYCPEWSKVWDANIDIQLALDPFAIVTYMVSYISKDETGMTQCLKEALQGKASEPLRERLKCLKLAYLKNRQMGASEAVYRFFLSMKLKNSNVTTLFVQTGFKENRTTFFKKVNDGDDSDAEEVEVPDDGDNMEEEVEIDQDEFTPSIKQRTIKLKDKAGRFKQGNSIHERYLFVNNPHFM